jgi:7-cyano-7-deazaguanine synthase
MKPSPLADPSQPLAVSVSGGLDSAILLGESLERHPAVHPLYIRTGLAWEGIELEHLRRFLKEVNGPALKPLVILEQPVADLYGDHWSVTGQDVPGAGTRDEAVYLPGRNVLLLAKALLWCHLNQVPALALAPLAANPFPDATPEFFVEFQEAVNRAVNGRVRVLWPYLNLSKVEVLQRGRHLPLRHMFSCMRPVNGKHCGACNKCAERQLAFAHAGVDDPTEYERSELKVDF